MADEIRTIGKIEQRPIVEEMQESYLDYAMSVIVSRALPDVRDGLKPVHRRILYAMWTAGLKPGARFRKSAYVVGETMSKFHPHGDVAIYDSLVRMAQDFSLRYPLITGQGNFGSMDGDAAAAMRYCVTGETRIVTEHGLEKIDSIANQEDINLRMLSRDKKINRATKWFASGSHPTLRITTSKGYTVTGSYNHPILTWATDTSGRPGAVWKRLDQLKIGDIAIIDRSDTFWPEHELNLRPYIPVLHIKRIESKIIPTALTPDLAFILGSICSEGTIGNKKIEFCNTDTQWIKEFTARWRRVFPDTRLHTFNRKPSSYGKLPYIRLEIHSQYVVTFLRNLGLLPVRSPYRRIPSAIFLSPRPVVSEFLRAYFEGDGSISSSKKMVELSCCSASETLIQELQILLLRFGIDTFRRFDPYRKTHKLYIRNVANYARFQHEIGFFSQRKRQKLEEVLCEFRKQSSKTDYIPFLSEMVRGTFGKEEVSALIHKHNFDRYDRLTTLHTAVSTAVEEKAHVDLQPFFLKLLKNHYLFEPIAKIEEYGMQPVFSVRVDSQCHSFIGNGFINHNTEAKLAPISEELLTDIEKDTVLFGPNYDGTQQEPKVVPARLPNLLLNGSMGIAVGMATNIPPHNLKELCGAIGHLIENPEATVDDLMKYVGGPDFPTGGLIYNKEDIKQAYATGRGSIVMRAKAEIVDVTRIIVTEIPYGVNKADLIAHIADLVRDKKLEGIRDLRDESNKEGVRMVIELKKDAYPKKVLNQLFDTTALQTAFHVNMLALVDGIQPRVLNLKAVLEEYVKYRQEVVRKRTAYDLERAKERAHILEGLKTAILHIDQVIATIKKSEDRDEARVNLMKKFKLTEIQANAILDMRLSSLANLERIRVETELQEKKELIRGLEAILASPKRILGVVKGEVEELGKKYGDARRTEIVPHAVKEFRAEDLIPDEPTIVMITADGYIKRLPPETFKRQARGGKGIIGVTTKEEDVVEHLFTTATHASLLFFTSRGRVFKLKAYEIPAATRTAKGQAVVNFLELAPGERVSAVLSLKELGEFKYLVMVTSRGLIKKVDISAFEEVRRSGLIAIKLKPEDNLGWVKPSEGKDDVMLVSAQGQAIRFKEADVRQMGRVASGVRGVRLRGKDRVVGMDVLDSKLVEKSLMELFVLMENGYGKRTNVKSYKVQRRGGSGVKTAKVTGKTGAVIGAFIANAKDERDLIVISKKGQVLRTPFRTISVQGRATQGVRVMSFKEAGDRVASVTFV